MANEFVHGSVGTELTQAEWEGVGTHVFNSQATGDIVYASSSSQLSRLAKGTDTHVLILSSGIPAWSASTGITAVGTIATGVWQGTDIGVAYGGTGVSTLTDGGILLGSGTGAITAMAVLTDGQMIVGNGSTDPVAESGADLRTSIGVGTGDSPQFSKFSIGGALDNQERLRIHPNTAPTTGSGTIFPVLQTTGGSVTVTGQSGAVYNHRFGSSTLTAGSSTTVPTYATVYIPSAATEGSNTTITANYALLVDAGTSRFDGPLYAATLSASAGTAGTVAYSFTDDPDTGVGMQSAGNLDLIVNGLLQARLSTSDLDMQDNDLLNVGASGNDWTQYRLIIEEGRDASVDLVVSNTTVGTAAVAVVKVATQYHATGGADPLVHWRIDGGTTQNWYAGIDNTDAAGRRFAIGTSLPGGADAMRITTARATLFYQAIAEAFDYVCDSCGRAKIKSFECCGTVAWHDDVLALREMNLSQSGIEQMAKLGVLEIDGSDTDSPGGAFINFQKGMHMTWAGMWQNRERMDAQNEAMDARLKRIEQALGV